MDKEKASVQGAIEIIDEESKANILVGQYKDGYLFTSGKGSIDEYMALMTVTMVELSRHSPFSVEELLEMLRDVTLDCYKDIEQKMMN